MTETYAHISADGQYRYTLGRRWGDGPVVTFVMLNPSTADAYQDDPTIRKCRGFAERHWGAGGIHVVNLYAYRSTKPIDLWAAARLHGADIVGPKNDDTLAKAFAIARRDDDPVVFAWGANAVRSPRVTVVRQLALAHDVLPLALAVTRDGIPGHPLMLAYANEPRPWEPA